MKSKILTSFTAAIIILSIFTACSNDGAESREIPREETIASESGETVSDFAETKQAESKKPVPIEEKELKLPPGARAIDIYSVYEGLDDTCWYIIDDIKAVDDNTICVFYNISEVTDGEAEKAEHTEICFFDLNTGVRLGNIVFPEKYTDYSIATCTGAEDENVLLKLYDYAGDGYPRSDKIKRVTTVFKDYSFKAEDKTKNENFITKIGNHGIYHSECNIIDADSNKIIVDGIYDGYASKSNAHQIFKFALDENRFVYSSYGYEWLNGFGIYDYKTKQCREIPDSSNLWPFGAYNGEIYSVSGEMDFFESKIYVTDADTLKTKILVDGRDIGITKEEYDDDFWNCKMPESGEYITMIKDSSLWILSPENGKVIKEYIFEDTGSFSSFFIGNRKIGINSYTDKKLYILDLTDVLSANQNG